MPDWNGATREQLYQYLAEGELALARQTLAKVKKLKKSDLRPINKEAMAAFSRHLQQNSELQRQLAQGLLSKRDSDRFLCELCFKQLKSFPGDILAEAFSQFANKYYRDSQQSAEAFMTQMNINPDLKGMVMSKFGLFTGSSTIIRNFVDIALQHPSIKSMEVLRDAPWLIANAYENRMPQIREVMLELKERIASGETRAPFQLRLMAFSLPVNRSRTRQKRSRKMNMFNWPICY